MTKKVSMQRIADALGISKVSVSKALNNQPGVGEPLRRQVLVIAQQMGYMMPQTVGGVHYRYAFICPKRFFLEDDTFYTTIYYYINKLCVEQGSSVASFIINSGDEMGGRLPESLCAERFDGLFIAGEFRRPFLDQVLGLPAARVTVDFYLPTQAVDCVTVNNFQLGQRVTDYLIRRGHRHIGFVGDPAATSSICDRYFGYQKALFLAGLPLMSDWHIVNNDAITGQYALQFQLPSPLPTAFVCHCDKAAFTLMQRLESQGIRVPEEVSVVGFDNTNLCELILPHLTSVQVDRRLIAHESLRAMQRRLENPQAAPRTYTIQGQLIERQSVSAREAVDEERFFGVQGS